MRDLPIVLKAIINIFLYIFYTVIAGVLVGVIYGRVLSLSDQSIPGEGDPVYTKMFILTALGVLIVSVLFRKCFYICSRSATLNIQQSKDDKGLKIQIEKEIK